jgi:hypothetical protein
MRKLFCLLMMATVMLFSSDWLAPAASADRRRPCGTRGFAKPAPVLTADLTRLAERAVGRSAPDGDSCHPSYAAYGPYGGIGFLRRVYLAARRFPRSVTDLRLFPS